MPTLEQWRAFYDGWAGGDPLLASTGTHVPFDDFTRLGDTLAGWLQLRGDEQALDVGCASGTLTSKWAGRAGRVVGVDFSARLCAEANARHAGTNLTFTAAEAAALPFATASFDRVVCFNVLLSLPDAGYATRAMDELLRVARPTARIVFGSLPDVRCQDRFFEVLRAASPWPRRVAARVRDLLRGGERRTTAILWFDIPGLCARFTAAGWNVEVHEDPPFANYRHYRRSLVLSRRTELET